MISLSVDSPSKASAHGEKSDRGQNDGVLNHFTRILHRSQKEHDSELIKYIKEATDF
jgi:hypothetical protein